MSTKEFEKQMSDRLAELNDMLKKQIKDLSSFDYPEQVKGLEFVYFSGDLPNNLPLRVFFMDGNQNEVIIEGEMFKATNANTEFESVKPLFDLDELDAFEDEDVDTFEASTEVFIDWFKGVWKEAVDPKFSISARVCEHSNPNEFVEL